MESSAISSQVLSKIESIAESNSQDDPFYILDLNKIQEKYDHFKIALPRVNPFYAVKSNSNRNVVKKLADLGIGFDCASKEEIRLITDLGVHPSRIIYANNTKALSHLNYARSKGVDLMTFDNESELDKIKEAYPKARLVMRITSKDVLAIASQSRKFGCDVDDAPKLLEKASVLGLNVVGTSFHVGIGCSDLNDFGRSIAACRKVFDCAKTFGYELNLVDIGGGFPGQNNFTREKYAKIINEALELYFPDKSVKVMAEPGQYFSCAPMTLACKIISVRNYSQKKSGKLIEDVMYYLNDGIHGSFSHLTTYGFKILPTPLKVRPNSKSVKSSLWGPSCCSRDCILEDIMLPEMNVGDWIIFRDMGAYTISNFTTFNGFQMPEIHVIDS